MLDVVMVEELGSEKKLRCNVRCKKAMSPIYYFRKYIRISGDMRGHGYVRCCYAPLDSLFGFIVL